MEHAINLKSVTKKYKLYKNKKERLLDFVLPKDYGEDFYAIKGIDFQASKGETIGLVGMNGSGKSTFLNMVAGIVPQTDGEIVIKGKVALISVSSGFKGTLTGRENLELKCLMLGFSEKEIEGMEDGIIEFAEISKFIDQPVKTYSSGMKSRLGFATSVNVDPDILIIDEALSVGDETFAKKCLDKINEFKLKGKTILFVSHNNNQIKQFCDKVLWLEFGKVKAYGPAEEVLRSYSEFTNQYKSMTAEQRESYRQSQELKC